MKNLLLFFLIFYGISFSQNFTLSGYLEDVETGESLIGANILIEEINIGGSTNNYGFFSLTVPQGCSSAFLAIATTHCLQNLLSATGRLVHWVKSP